MLHKINKRGDPQYTEYVLPKILYRHTRLDLLQALRPIGIAATTAGRAMPKTPRILERMLDVVVPGILKDRDELCRGRRGPRTVVGAKLKELG